MTRKQAVHRVIEILSNDPHNDYTEICEKLQEILIDMNSLHWSKERVIDAIQQYYLDNHELPYAKTCKINKDLPTPKAIEILFNMSYSDFLTLYFPEEIELTQQYRESIKQKEYTERKEKHIENFKKYYIEMGRPSMKVYKQTRPKESPSIRYLEILTGYTKWNDILRYCGFEVFKYRKKNEVLNTEVDFINANADKIKEINIKLQEILDSSKS